MHFGAHIIYIVGIHSGCSLTTFYVCYALLSLTVENKQAGTSLVQNVQDFIACTYLVPENLAGYTRAFH